MSNIDIIKKTEQFMIQTYNRQPIAIVSGSGMKVKDADGKEYLDFVSGVAVCNLGHCHPKISSAITSQVGKLMHISNLYHIEPQVQLAQVLVENSFADKVFFCNSGSEAVESAIKLARKYFSSQAKDGEQSRFQVITMEKSFHGRTMAAMAATGQVKVQKGYEPLLEEFKYIPFNDIDALKNAISEKTCAVMVEPIQGEGGVNVPDENYLKQVKGLCDEYGTLLIFDEVQVGIGRTGKLFAYEHYGVTPHIMTLAKGLANGFPIGAMCAVDEVARAFGYGSHGSTFGGNPLATIVAKTVLDVFKEDNILENCNAMGSYLQGKLEELKNKFDIVKHVRGKGLMWGMELSVSGAPIIDDLRDNGILLNCTSDTILRFIPPLIITKEDIDVMITKLDSALGNI